MLESNLLEHLGNKVIPFAHSRADGLVLMTGNSEKAQLGDSLHRTDFSNATAAVTGVADAFFRDERTVVRQATSFLAK